MTMTGETAAGDGLMGSTRFARVVFTIAGFWGFLIMTPLYFAFDAIGRSYPPPITHPEGVFQLVHRAPTCRVESCSPREAVP